MYDGHVRRKAYSTASTPPRACAEVHGRWGMHHGSALSAPHSVREVDDAKVAQRLREDHDSADADGHAVPVRRAFTGTAPSVRSSTRTSGTRCSNLHSAREQTAGGQWAGGFGTHLVMSKPSSFGTAGTPRSGATGAGAAAASAASFGFSASFMIGKGACLRCRSTSTASGDGPPFGCTSTGQGAGGAPGRDGSCRRQLQPWRAHAQAKSTARVRRQWRCAQGVAARRTGAFSEKPSANGSSAIRQIDRDLIAVVAWKMPHQVRLEINLVLGAPRQRHADAATRPPWRRATGSPRSPRELSYGYGRGLTDTHPQRPNKRGQPRPPRETSRDECATRPAAPGPPQARPQRRRSGTADGTAGRFASPRHTRVRVASNAPPGSPPAHVAA